MSKREEYIERLKQQLDEIGVVARVAPEDKIRLVTLLQDHELIKVGPGCHGSGRRELLRDGTFIKK